MLSGRRDVPLHQDASSRFFPWLITVMVYLAALALVIAMAMHKVAERWDKGLAGRLTIQIPAIDPEGDPSAEPGGRPGDNSDSVTARVDATLEILLNTPGIRSAQVLETADIAGLLEPWLGQGESLADLPLPQLIAVTLDSDEAPAVERLAEKIAAAAPGTIVEDHQRWLGNLLDLAHTIELISALVVLLVCLSAIVMVIFVTRMSLAIHHQIVELLHLIGAQDAYVAKQFQAHALRLGLRGGFVGLALAVATVFLLGRLLRRIEGAILPDLTLTSVEWLVLALLPLVVAGITMLTARLTVLRDLAEMP